MFAPLSEELLFRGWLYTGIRAKLPAWPTILITAALFALVHLPQGLEDVFAAALPLGVIAGYLRERTGSVKSTIPLHILANAAASIL